MSFDGDKGLIKDGGSVTSSPAVQMRADDQTLENFGRISLVGVGAEGIRSTGANATITNSGSISVEGPLTEGIRSDGTNATITNSGRISVVGVVAEGIMSTGANALITNSGSISAVGNNNQGIWSTGANALITNSGSISAVGDSANVIRSDGTNATITNSGSISAVGLFTFGITSTGANATITNSGSISAVGTGADGIRSDGANAAITNSGRISVAGSGVDGISSTGTNATITNSSSIISDGDAVRFSLGSATLNLLAGTAMQGGIVFTGSGNTVNFGPGLNALMTFTGVPNVGDTSGNPYVVLGNQIAVLDRAGFVLGDDMTLALAGDIAEAPAPRFAACLPDDDMFGNQVPGDERPAEDCATQGYITGLGGFGGQAAADNLAGFSQMHGAVLAGLEFAPGNGFGGGLFIGAAAARGTVGTSQETALHGAVTGGHASFARDGYFANFYAALGVLQLESARTVADNTVTGGLDVGSSTFHGYFLNPAVTVGADLDTGDGTLTPSLRLRYTGLMLDGYAESGANDGLAVDARMVHELELRAQLALALTPSATEHGTVSTTVRAGADIIHRQANVSAELLGQDIAFTSGGEGMRYRGFAAAEFDVALKGGINLFGNLELGLDTAGGYSSAAQMGMRGNF
ncbi:autotransporter domain-containing protein [Devosia sp.]|uniref:autotransporter outer membrane beta-barrel domain-containing protein n=1 Tax=Devosia sp. TaxID=1871048 RepID=UPI0037C01EF5